jgi:hypothetical protein
LGTKENEKKTEKRKIVTEAFFHQGVSTRKKAGGLVNHIRADRSDQGHFSIKPSKEGILVINSKAGDEVEIFVPFSNIRYMKRELVEVDSE